MLSFMITSNKIKNSLQVIQNKALKSIFRLNKKTNTKLLHIIANKDTIDVILIKQAKKYLQKAQFHNNAIATVVKNSETTYKKLLNIRPY